MTDLYQCPDCGREYRSDKLASCPGCGHDNEAFEHLHTESVSTSGDEYQIELISAANRTTHAVRSLAIFFFVNLFWSSTFTVLCTIAIALPKEINCDFDCALQFSGLAVSLFVIAAITGFVGAFIAFRLAIRELKASRVYSSWW
jgi:hypothetical protein